MRGGDGIERRIKFLQPMTVSMLANRRAEAPHGLEGGSPGALGENWVERTGGADGGGKSVIVEHMGHRGSTTLNAGDVFVIKTPGGGGFGVPVK